jgi:hypothetical protein
VQKQHVIITNVNDDEKMLRFNINLIVNKHFKIIGVNDCHNPSLGLATKPRACEGAS